MAKLAQKAKKSKSSGRLAQKAKISLPTEEEKTPDQQLAENTTLPTVSSQPPTPPPPLPYLRYFSTIPSLRNKTGVQ